MPADTAFLDSLTVKKFGPEIDVSRFSCSEAVEWFLRNKAAEFQDLRLSAVTCWLAGDDLAGFATTNMHVLEVESSQDREHLGVSGIVVREGGRHYRLFPALLIGVLGVCTQYRRRGLGERVL